MIQACIAMVLGSFIAFSSYSVRAEDRIEVDGKAYFTEVGHNTITKWDVKILVPPKGDGVVSVVVGEYTFDAISFFTLKKNDKTTFVVVLPLTANNPSIAGFYKGLEGDYRYLVMAGTYQRAGEMVRYSGDAWAIKNAAKSEVLKLVNHKDEDGSAKFAGTFSFEQGFDP